MATSNSTSRTAAAPTKTLPKVLMFSGKNIEAEAIGDSCSFGKSQQGNTQIAVPFRITAGQRATLYACPEGFQAKPGESFEIPEGTVVNYVKALTTDAAPYAAEALRNAGWQGSKWSSLAKGIPEGLGETRPRLTIEISETDKDGNPLVDDDGNFRPQMRVSWVNSGSGFKFKQEATMDDLTALDREHAALLKPPARAAAKESAAKTPAPAPGKVIAPTSGSTGTAAKTAAPASGAKPAVPAKPAAKPTPPPPPPEPEAEEEAAPESAEDPGEGSAEVEDDIPF